MPDRNIVFSELDPARAAYEFTLEAGEPWLYPIQAGQIVRIVDLCGNQAVDTFFFNADDLAERYSPTATIVAQRNIYLTAGTRAEVESESDADVHNG